VPNPVICAACRTPVGRYGGALATVRPDDLAALVVREAAQRAGLDPAAIDDVILGAANQSGEDNRNVARMATLLAGFPPSVSATTVNRLCASGLQAVQSAAHAVHARSGDVFIAGGVESMSRAPLVTAKPDRAFGRGDRTLYDTTLGWRFVNPELERRYGVESMGATGENVAAQYAISREDQDAWALKSQQAWARADAEGRFARELVAVEVAARRGETLRVERDEHPRPDTTAEGLARLAPAFRAGGSVTAGNAAGINDGAAALVIADQARADALGLPVRARIVATASAGVEPRIMGMGPLPATGKVLERAGLAVSDIDLVELNEAFASQVVACVRELGLDPQRVNVNGGAIAIGHPLGASGARMLVTLLHELERRDARYGLATMCVGVGQGQAVIIERLARNA
jgi:3-oxoadipyl-CoA thiolase